MTHSLNSLKGIYIGDYIKGTTIGDSKGDTRSLDYSSYEPMWFATDSSHWLGFRVEGLGFSLGQVQYRGWSRAWV